ncbi:HXXEE domain-containing protein [Haloferax sp. ATB1]|uniref:HXXEE domain-containing protein n=1 Tax=Haloferax sp. ATB1 TaxID=1508454 RepID=UPI0005B1E3B1|nr:HXXEE domain-containing protein [Haloferax sp. ATB1]
MAPDNESRSIVDSIVENNLYLVTGLGVIVAAWVLLNWSTLPLLQRLVGLFFVATVLHLWEEGKIPGGFTDLIAEQLDFVSDNQHFGEIITVTYVLFITLVPLFFPQVVFLAMAPMMLGVVEVVAHLAMIRMFDLDRFYSPGLLTAVFLMLPISVVGIVYTLRQGLLEPLQWVFSIVYMLAGLMLAQQVVIRMSGMSYAEFLENVRKSLFKSSQ